MLNYSVAELRFIKKTVPDKKGTHKKEKKSHFSLHEPSQNQ